MTDRNQRRRLPWRPFDELTPAERDHRLGTMQGISFALMGLTVLMIYGLIVAAILSA